MADRRCRVAHRYPMAVTLICLLVTALAPATLGEMIRIKTGDDPYDQGARLYAQRYGVSLDTGGRLFRDRARQSGAEIIDEFGLPEGALLDFYKVRNSGDPDQRVEYQGRGRLVNAYSYLGRHMREMLFGLLNTEYREQAIALLRQARDHGFMIVPAAVGRRGGEVRTQAAQTVTAIVIAPEFPHWNDPRPMSNGDTTRENPPTGTDMYYFTTPLPNLPPPRDYPMNGNNHAWEQPFPEQSDWYADSPGGTIAYGIPIGMQGNLEAWTGAPTDTSNPHHPRAGGDSRKPQLTLKDDWYNWVFNQGYAFSLTNYLYENTHGHLRLEGDYSHVIGWVRDHHVLDRFPSPTGIYYAVQPGTPLLRPQNPAGPMLVRASLWWDGSVAGVTIFARQPVTVGGYWLEVEQLDTDSTTDGNQPGWVTLTFSSPNIERTDPWDNRRWTFYEGDWEFDSDPAPDEVEMTDYEFYDGGQWRLHIQLNGVWYTWQNGSAGYMPQGRGCGSLSGTTFTANDILQPEPGNRLLSFCYYTHDHIFNPNGSAYQLRSGAARGNSAYEDPIAGVDDPRFRVDRPAPFDHDRYDDANHPNAGFGDAPHDAATMRSHVLQTLADQGITYSGFDRIIFLYPADAGHEDETNPHTIIPHASGGVITVPDTAGLTLLAHELLHTFGAADTYDCDFYNNNLSMPPPVPPYFECNTVSPYSVMAFGGYRLDPWHKIRNSLIGSLFKGPYAEATAVTADLGLTQIWQVETTLRDPVILKLPAHPLAVYARKWLDANPGTVPPGYPGTLADFQRLADPDQWKEYFLIENRNLNGANYFGDPSPRGLYIWHIDERNIGHRALDGNPYPNGYQVSEETLTVALEQADGLNELETNTRAQGVGNLAGDPFPGSTGNRNFTERTKPSSWSHGVPDVGGETIRPDTPTDSFVRVTNISDPGNPMSAYIYVEPAEIIATMPKRMVPPPNPPNTYYQVPQGLTRFPVMLLNLNNNGVYPNLSTNPVTIRTLRVREIGTSLQDRNIALARLYLDANNNGWLDVNEDDNGNGRLDSEEDTNDNGVLDPGEDSNGNGRLDSYEDRNYNGVLDTADIDILLATSTVTNDNIYFRNLGYVIPLNENRNFIVAYDIAKDATTEPAVTVGAELTSHLFITPEPPGAVQQRVRRDGTGPAGPGYDFGDRRFPITDRTAQIVESPDTLHVESQSLAPPTAPQGSTDVEMLQLALWVDDDAVRIIGFEVDQIGDAVSGDDVSLCRLYDDPNGNGRIDPGEQLLGETSFVGGKAQISGLSLEVTATYEIPRKVILAVNISNTATLDRKVQLELIADSITLATNPHDPYKDTVDYTNFPHTSGETIITRSNEPPSLSAPGGDYTQALKPKYGLVTDTYEFRVIYTDVENDPPPSHGIWLQLDGDPLKRIRLRPRDPADTDYTDGAEYFCQVPGSAPELGVGAHRFEFYTFNDTVKWPTENDPEAAGKGPIIGGLNSSVRLIDVDGNDVDAPLFYEEGSPIFVEVHDPDENADPTVAETVSATVTDSGFGDTEMVVLTETGEDTGVFWGTIPTLGGAGQPGDGILNAIGGPNGNVITALYKDKDSEADCPPDLVDTSSDTALLLDTVPPPPAQAHLQLVSGPHGRSIQMDWTDYGPTAPMDLNGYEIYVQVAPFTSVASLTPRATVAAGTVSYNLTSLVPEGLDPDRDYWVAVVPIDEVPNRDANVTGQRITTRDTVAPVLQNPSPQNGAIEVPVNTNIAFSLVDPGSGVDPATVHVFVNGTEVTQLLGAPTGTPQNLRYEYDPPTDFAWNSQVTVQVTCDDVSGNHLDDTFSFHVRTDWEGPTITSQSPAPGAANISPSTAISFHIQDNISGVDVSSIQVLVNGQDVTADCTINSSNPLDVVVTYQVGGHGYAWGQPVAVSVTAQDNAGNELAPTNPTSWSFTTEQDTDPPTISNLNPAADATGVATDTTISFRLADAKSGVDQDTLRVFINEVQVPTEDLTITGTPHAMTINYAPPPFDFDAVVTVRVFVRDRAGNVILDEFGQPTDGYRWTFTCKAAPRYRILGNIIDQDDRPLPGVVITVTQNGSTVATTRTNGNGTFVLGLMLPGNYRLTPSLDQYSFAPQFRDVTIVDQDITGLDFQGTLRTFRIQGRVTIAGEGKPGVTVTDGVRTAVTNAQGDYTITGVPNGRYTVQPSLAYHHFRPASQAVVIEDADATGVDFEAVPDTFTIRGFVRDYDGNRIQGVRVTDGTRSAVTNEAGQYILSEVPAGTVTLSASKTGYIITPTSQAVTVPPSATDVDFVAYLSFTNSFPRGINFIGLPCLPADVDPVAVFGTDRVARWNPGGNPPGYLLASRDVGNELLEVRPGRGFFVDLPRTELRVAGRPVSESQVFTLTLGPLWNMVANMYRSPLSFADIRPQLPGTVREYGYVYDPTTGSYLLVSATPGVNVARTHINPWEGVWLRTTGGPATVTVARSASSSEAAPVAPQALALGSGGWTIPVMAQAGNRQDTSTTVGVAPALANPVELENPPMAPHTVDVYVASEDGRYLSQQIHGGAATEQSWTLVVCTDLPNTEVALSLPDLSQVPNDLAVYLTDLTTGKRYYARTLNRCVFTSGESGGERRYRLEVRPRDGSGLVITNASAVSSGGNIVVTYNVSRDCRTDIRVTNIAGRVVRVLARNRESVRGVHSVVWNKRSAEGVMVPSGRYLIQIEATGEDGQKVQTIVPTVISR